MMVAVFTVPIIATTVNRIAVTTHLLCFMEVRQSWPFPSHVPVWLSSHQGHILLSLLPRTGLRAT